MKANSLLLNLAVVAIAAVTASTGVLATRLFRRIA